LPTTLIGLIIFVVLLAPGFIYLTVAERGPLPSRQVSVLRETATVALSSVFFNLIALLLFGLLRTCVPSLTPDVGKLIVAGHTYFRTHYVIVIWWGVGLLALACALALVWAGVMNSTERLKPVRSWPLLKFLTPAHGVQNVSTWWDLLYEYEPDRERRVRCRLEDGSYVEGWLFSFTAEAEETDNRNIALSAPLVVQDPHGAVQKADYGAITISAKRILDLYVNYD
jgi:hypothetical protein